MIFSNKTTLLIVKYISKTLAAGITYIILIYTDVLLHKNYSDVGILGSCSCVV
jgi:hypothetical protein